MFRGSILVEDFIEMLKRGDSPEEVARYGNVRIAAVERRFFRLPKQVRDEIIKCRNGRPFYFWELIIKEKING